MVPWVDTTEHLVFLFLVVVASKVVGPKLATFLDKKVVEAKARKKRRANNRMEKMKKKADTITENMGMSDYDKAQQIRT